MSGRSPGNLSEAQRRARHARIVRSARKLGFVGRIEYKHIYSQTGGAQYGMGVKASGDMLIVYAEAFERDRDPDDFSLDAILAHERGHQLLARHTRISRLVVNRVSPASEEILASLLGAMICFSEQDRDALMAKATAELLDHGEVIDVAVRRLQELWELLETVL